MMWYYADREKQHAKAQSGENWTCLLYTSDAADE